jgi:cell division protein FtsL|tara:strand:+ start:274 stop:612 length:339 start_codon:yes stop_codon:yes gene_type:complete
MFKSKIIISTIIFLILLIITSIVKNQTRLTEKKLYNLNKKINLQERDINESQLDFYFLTSPSQLEKKIKTLGLNNYSPINNSKIFLSLSDFSDLQKKISIFRNQYEKKTQKN